MLTRNKQVQGSIKDPVWDLLPQLRNIATFLGIFGAGFLIVTRELWLCFSGWAYIMIRRPYVIGDRIQLGAIAGDVIDIRMFETSLMEVTSTEGGLVAWQCMHDARWHIAETNVIFEIVDDHGLPTDGLDPNQKHEVRTLIQGLAKDKIVIVSTHILEEVHAVCTRAIIIANGRIVADATPDELEARSRYHHAVTLRSDDLDALKAALTGVAGVDEVVINSEDKMVTAFPRKGQAIFGPISRLIQERKLAVSELLLERGRLDEVFRTITQTGARS